MAWGVETFWSDGPHYRDFFERYPDVRKLEIDIDDGERVDITVYFTGSDEPHGPSCLRPGSRLRADLEEFLNV